ncbi:MAG TPA: hypothetical protein VF161_07470 [Steroidobacteraceae bacterium]
MDKSDDHADCIMRHLLDLGELLAYAERVGEDPEDGRTLHDEPELIKALLDEADALAWRALALNQTLRMRFTNAAVPFNAQREPVPEVPAYEDERAAKMYAAGFRDGMAEGTHAAELAADDIIAPNARLPEPEPLKAAPAECRSPYCQCEKDKCRGGWKDMRGVPLNDARITGEPEHVRSPSIAEALDIISPKCITDGCERRAAFGSVRCQTCLDTYIADLRKGV